MSLRGKLAVVVMFGVLAMLVGPAKGAAATDDTPTYPAPETYLPHYSDYRDATLAFLAKKSVDSNVRARAAMDLLEISYVLDDPGTSYEMHKRLLLDFTDSYQTKYLISQLRDPSEFTGLMYNIFVTNVQDVPAGLPTKFVAATKAGLSRFRLNSLLAGQEFVAFTAIMAHQAGDMEMQNSVMNVLKEFGQQGIVGLAIARIMTDEQLTAIDRLTTLHEKIPAHGSTIPFERMLVNQMKAADRDLPAVQKILADDDVLEGRLTDGLGKLDKLPPDLLDARLTFWRGWATAVKGDSARAGHILRDLAKASPADPWGKLAGDLAPDVEAQAENLAAATDNLFAAVAPFHDSIKALEMQAEFEAVHGPPVHVYLGILAKQSFDLVATQGEVVRVAYHSTEKDSSVYFADEKKKWVFDSGGLIAVPTIKWNGAQLTVSSDASWQNTPDDILTTIHDLAKLPFLASRGGVTDWLDNFVKQGTLPGHVQTDGNVKTYKWLHPGALEPKVETTTYSLDSKTSAVTFSRGGFKITSLRVAGDDQELTLSPPAMPSVPEANTIHAEKVDREVAARVLGAIERVIIPPTTQPSTQPTTRAILP